MTDSFQVTRRDGSESQRRQLHRCAHRAIATRFECCFLDEERPDAISGAECVFAEIDRLESLLSYFIPSSDVARFNAQPVGKPLSVGVELLDCLHAARTISEDTQGAFDPFIGAYLPGRQHWQQPPDQVSQATGPPAQRWVPAPFQYLQMDRDQFTVTKKHARLEMDLGGMAKGYALDQGALALADLGYAGVLLHSGQSTFRSLPSDPAAESWTMRLLNPVNEADELGSFILRDLALSCSAQGDCPHILDPASGQAVAHYLAVWALAPTAIQADALSTAFMVMPMAAIEQYCRDHGDVQALVLQRCDPLLFHTIGNWLDHSLTFRG